MWTAAGAVTALFTLGACASHPATLGAGGIVGGAPSTAPAPIASAGTPTQPQTSAPATRTTTKKPPSGPKIVELTWAQKPTCETVASSANPLEIPAKQGILEWKTSGGVTSVALSIDAPDFFKQNGTGSFASGLPANDQYPVNFECDPSTNEQFTKHTYTIDTVGGGTSVEKSITYSTQTSP